MHAARFVQGSVFALLLFSTAAGAATPRAVFEKYGLFGTWAADCTEPASFRRSHVVYSPLGGEGVEKTSIWRGRVYVYSLESAVELASGELVFTWKGARGKATNTVRLRRDEMQVVVAMRLIDSTLHTGEKIYLNGRSVRSSNATPWVSRCGDGGRQALRLRGRP